MPPAVIRWQIGQTAICHCTGSPRQLAVLRGGANRLPMLEIPDSEPHECPTATKRSKLGRPGCPESATIRLSGEAISAAKARAEVAGTTARALIEGLIFSEKSR